LVAAVSVRPAPGRRGRVENALKFEGGEAAAYIVDVADHDAMVELAAKVETELGPVTALVTPACILDNSDTILNMDLDEHQRVWDVNCSGRVDSVRAFAPYLERRQKGAIVMAGSVNRLIQLPLSAFNPSKAAIKRLTELLCMELGRNNERVNGVAPNYTKTPAIKQRIAQGAARS